MSIKKLETLICQDSNFKKLEQYASDCCAV